MRDNILDYTLDELMQKMTSLGAAPYRAKQVFSWLHQKMAHDFGSMTDLPGDLQTSLAARYITPSMVSAGHERSEDKETEKFLWELQDKEYVETVLIRSGKRRTVCLSTQVGCKFGCPFCASGAMGFVRDLSPGEIVGQLLSVQRITNEKISNIVFMGMGEALDNYDNVTKAIKIINHPAGINLGARKITVSTCGVIPGIKKLAELKPHVELSVSLHSLDNEKRNMLVPANRKYPLKDLLPECVRYRERTGRAVTIEYTVIKGVNDSAKDAVMLGDTAKKIKAKVNLIACSGNEKGKFRSPDEIKDMVRFRDIVRKKGVAVTIRASKGRDISAACGQLAGRKKQTKRTAGAAKKQYDIIVLDVDGTITKHISSWRYIHEKLGLWDVLAKKYQEQFLAGKIDYKRFCELDAAHWKGIPQKKMREIFKKVPYSKNAEKAIKTLKEEGFKLVAVSTGLQFITDRIKEEMAFDHVIGNRLIVRKGTLTGGVQVNISHGAKGETLKKILKKFNIPASRMIAVGDSEGDIPMAELAGYSIAFNSTSEELSKIVDYECGTLDFMEVLDVIMEVANGEKRGKKTKK